jgi:chemotaxis protein methyltransferase CheR
MGDDEWVRFLQWSLPKLHLRWEGFRRVRRQVIRRVRARVADLRLDGPSAYRAYLEGNDEEWRVLDPLCRVTISRFYRDRGVFDGLGAVVLPALADAALARGAASLDCWSAGCASGEEPYSLSLLWHFRLRPRYPGLSLRIVASEADAAMLERARRATYSRATLRELPEDWLADAFDGEGDSRTLRPVHAGPVTWLRQDLREAVPDRRFDLVLCRNLAFTYYDDVLQRDVLERIAGRMAPGGGLVIGAHEQLPAGRTGFEPWPGAPCVHRRS